KTMLARAVANATEANFIPVKGPEVLDKFVGESERAVRDLFDRARQHAPSVVFFDEVDAIAPRRGRSFGTHAVERVVSQLLTELDGLEPLEDVVVLAATNRPDVIDPALLRPGRLEQVVEVPLPDRTARREIFAVHTREVPTADLDLDALADATTGYTGSDIAAVVREASLLAIEEFVTGDRAAAPTVTAEHLARALVTVEPAAERTAGQFGRDTEADERAPDDRERGET
ncbi:MAG: 26S protease regulatory subunit, partial [Halodesulfurarchaeum sp.]